MRLEMPFTVGNLTQITEERNVESNFFIFIAPYLRETLLRGPLLHMTGSSCARAGEVSRFLNETPPLKV